ncbi:MAG: SDR family NAD(P)-dependent oxidoreductase [Alphaproteobacteria bacterium]|jgi:hypothetical protein|nr:SDR family NAD(P)-dependent oxidoreductase [Alphaproteobacteria bacterium]MDP6564974.1 SDR family NAD(P)-dependent oxidoreductase [Alphaproteobacteria bacterium]MDP6811802.1 SDR family NAD(P)-dependent oxidoreductase [Alphaproteobacteria bacterium]
MSYEPFDLSGKVALVTGGNSGIGLGFADAMARAGADVCIWGTNEEKNANALAQLQAHGGKAAAMRCNVASEEEVEASFAEAVKQFGKVDSCFANAGVSGRGEHSSFIEMTSEEWRRVMSVNLDGAFFTFRAACRHMAEAGNGGRLVGTASLAAIEGAPRSEHYAATKGGLISMILSLAVGMARHGVTANAVLPGWIETPMTDRTFAWDKFAAAVKPRIPSRRWGTGEDFGGVAVYLASDASSYHSGDTFVIDGAYNKF